MMETFSDKDRLQRFEPHCYGELFLFADKSTNLHEMSNPNYNRLLGNNIISDYRNAETVLIIKLTKKLKKLAESLDLSKKMECYARHLAFINIKDHKPNFEIALNAD